MQQVVQRVGIRPHHADVVGVTVGRERVDDADLDVGIARHLLQSVVGELRFCENRRQPFVIHQVQHPGDVIGRNVSAVAAHESHDFHVVTGPKVAESVVEVTMTR